jgi:myosin heavy subunit
MAQQEYEDFKFPDEAKAEQPEAEEEFEIEIEDDTPPEDRGHSPMPKNIVDELEQDELEQFTGKAKEKLHQLKKVWNDERRAKEAASKEAAEAARIAQQLLNENQQLKTKLSAGEQNLHNKYKENISYELEKAKSAYKEAYDSGDSDRLVEAQERLTTVQMEAKQIERYQPEYSEDTLQNSETQVQIPQQPQRLEPKTQSWLDKNSWYGVDDDMSFLAMGIHRRLEREGVAVGSDHYFGVIDKEMRQRFPEKFEGGETKYSSEVEIKPSTKTSKPSTVVAPATRSTSPKRVKLTPTQVQLAKKFNLTPEQYARELTKLESQNG